MSFTASDMDGMLDDFGCKTVTITRAANGATVNVRAFFRQAIVETLAGNGAIFQQKVTVVISATEILNTPSWPGSNPAGFPGDPRVPWQGDSISIEGRDRAITAAHPIYVDDQLVRVNLEVAG